MTIKEAEIGVMRPQVRESDGGRKLEEAESSSPLTPLKGVLP